MNFNLSKLCGTFNAQQDDEREIGNSAQRSNNEESNEKHNDK